MHYIKLDRQNGPSIRARDEMARYVTRFYTCWHGMASAFALPHFPRAVNYSIDNAVSLAVLIL